MITAHYYLDNQANLPPIKSTNYLNILISLILSLLTYSLTITGNINFRQLPLLPTLSHTKLAKFTYSGPTNSEKQKETCHNFLQQKYNQKNFQIRFNVDYCIYYYRISNGHWILIHPNNPSWREATTSKSPTPFTKNVLKSYYEKKYSYSDATKKTIPTSGTIGKKSPRQKLAQAQTLQKSYESHIDKYQGTTLLENVTALALRAEMVFPSTCILIGGLPLDHADWPPHRLNEWIRDVAHQLHVHLGLSIDTDQLNEYIEAYEEGCTIHPEADSCSFPIPIARHHFQLGGGNSDSDLPPAFGINPGGPGELFYMYQALPMDSINSLREVRAAVELCTFRGIPGNIHEAQAVLSLIQNRVDNHIAPLCQLPSSSFDVVLHRRTNFRAHYPNNKLVHEFIITVYCRPQGKSIGSLREKLVTQNKPSESNLDCVMEIWGSYYSARTTPPSMLLLNRTPYFCIYGFPPSTTTEDIMAAFIADNPDYQPLNTAYFWIGPYNNDGPKGLHIIFYMAKHRSLY